MTDTPARAGDAFAPLAPWVFVFLTSTGFVMARYATDDAGPLTFVALRVAIACSLLTLIALATGAPRPTRSGFMWSALAGLGLQAVYVSGVFLSIEAGLPAGVSALIGALHPVMTAAVAGPLLGERLRPLQWLGVGLGGAATGAWAGAIFATLPAVGLGSILVSTDTPLMCAIAFALVSFPPKCCVQAPPGSGTAPPLTSCGAVGLDVGRG